MFRRRRRDSVDEAGYQPGQDGPGQDGPGQGDAGQHWAGGAGPASDWPAGPWDADDEIPAAERIDFGSVQVPVTDGVEIQVNMAEEHGAWVTVVRGDSGLQVQAFAAPKSSGLWDEVRQEIAVEVARTGGTSEEADGPFGPELRARVAAGEPGQPAPRGAHQHLRFLGVDGPRWFLRGMITGPAATRPELARPLEEVFEGVVVIRGPHPAAPRELLEIRLPEQARQALDEQMAEAGKFGEMPSPFERGPEITEIR